MNVLAPVESRFPLTGTRTVEKVAGAEAQQPFGARFFRSVAAPVQRSNEYTYCDELQVAVDSTGVPMVQGHPSALWELTSTANYDGNEETKMDDNFL